MTSFERDRPGGLRRPRAVALVAVALVLAACGGPEPAATEPETRTVSHPLGEVQVPEEPASILATDEYAALNLLALGVEPAVVYGSFGSEVGRVVLEDAGITVVPGATFSESPPIEEIIGHAPDMIVMTGGAEMQETYDALSPVAPVVAVPYYDTTWQESMTAAGAAVARTDRAESMIRTLEGRIGAVQAASEPGPTSLSVVAETYGDCCFSAARGTPLSTILQAAGFTRPAAQDIDATYGELSVLPISPEQLGAHDADLVIVPDGEYYSADAVRAQPVFRSLPAVRDGRVLQVDGDLWFGNFAFAVHWIATDLEAVAQDGAAATVGVPGDATARWEQFRADVGG